MEGWGCHTASPSAAAAAVDGYGLPRHTRAHVLRAYVLALAHTYARRPALSPQPLPSSRRIPTALALLLVIIIIDDYASSCSTLRSDPPARVDAL